MGLGIMSTAWEGRIRAQTRKGSMKYSVHLSRIHFEYDETIKIRDWCNENIGDCHLLWAADIPGILYSFNCKKDAVLFSLRWL